MLRCGKDYATFPVLLRYVVQHLTHFLQTNGTFRCYPWDVGAEMMEDAMQKILLILLIAFLLAGQAALNATMNGGQTAYVQISAVSAIAVETLDE